MLGVLHRECTLALRRIERVIIGKHKLLQIKAVAVFRPYNSRLAEELAGKELLVDSSCFECAGDAATGMDVLVGFTVYDMDMRVIGPVAGFLDYPGNPCIEVEAANGRVVLPFAEQLVLSIDEESRIICLEIPDGLL